MTETRCIGPALSVLPPFRYAPGLEFRLQCINDCHCEERSVEEIRRRFGKAVIGRAAARLHTDLWSPDLEKTQVIHPIGLLKTSIS